MLVEGCIRLIPGVLGQPQSLLEESFSNNLLEYPHYTRPKSWEDIQGNKHEVPEVLTSGHHEKIDKWRKEKSVEKTKELRPDFYKKEKKGYKMSNLLETFEKKQIEKLTSKKRVPAFRPGDTLKVTVRITEGR